MSRHFLRAAATYQVYDVYMNEQYLYIIKAAVRAISLQNSLPGKLEW